MNRTPQAPFRPQSLRSMRMQSAAPSRVTPPHPTANEQSVDRLERITGMYATLEALVELLDEATAYGPTALLEQRYQLVRQRFQRSYPSLKQSMIAFLGHSFDADGNSTPSGRGTRDVVEALFEAPSLTRRLACDNGTYSRRADLAKTALVLFAEHLRVRGRPEVACE